MRKFEMKECRRCKKLYRWESGGIVLTPSDSADRGLCDECRKIHSKPGKKDSGGLFC